MRYLAAILRIADALDRTHARLVRAVRCAISARTVEVRVDADGDPELELWAARRKGDLFEELCGRKLRFAVDQVRDAAPSPVRREATRREASPHDARSAPRREGLAAERPRRTSLGSPLPASARLPPVSSARDFSQLT